MMECRSIFTQMTTCPKCRSVSSLTIIKSILLLTVLRPNSQKPDDILPAASAVLHWKTNVIFTSENGNVMHNEDQHVSMLILGFSEKRRRAEVWFV